jgi:hypothetical protein
MNLPDIQSIVAMPPGPEMDRLIHVLVLKQEKKSKTPKYSSDITRAIEIIEHLPLHVGYLAQTMENFTPTRPYFASDGNQLIVTADTPAKALCKAALIYLRDNLPGERPAEADAPVTHQPEEPSNEAAAD